MPKTRNFLARREERKAMRMKKATFRKLKRLGRQKATKVKVSYNDVIAAEANLGRTIFGPVPDGHQREFFEAHPNIWLWYESWTDPSGAPQSTTVRYEVQPSGVYKTPSNGNFSKLEGAELTNFCAAVRRYFELVKANLYR